MNVSLVPIPSVLLGSAAARIVSPEVGATLEGDRWRATWTDSAGVRVQAVAPLAVGCWTLPVPVPEASSISMLPGMPGTSGPRLGPNRWSPRPRCRSGKSGFLSQGRSEPAIALRQ